MDLGPIGKDFVGWTPCFTGIGLQWDHVYHSYFVATAKESSFTQAAPRCSVLELDVEVVCGSASQAELGCVDDRRPCIAFRQTAGIYPLMPFEAPCACSTLRRATRALTAMYDAALAASGLRITQLSVLSALARLGPLPVTRLAAEVALDRSTMGRNLDPLERRGLVRITVRSATSTRASVSLI